MNNYCLIVFKNTMDAIKTEGELKKSNIKAIVMPTPTQISKSCGISIKFDTVDLDLIKNKVNDKSITIKNIYIKEYDVFNEVM